MHIGKLQIGSCLNLINGNRQKASFAAMADWIRITFLIKNVSHDVTRATSSLDV